MTKRYVWTLIGSLAGLAAAGAGHTQAPTTTAAAPLLQSTFEADAGGWAPLGTTAKVAVTHEAQRPRRHGRAEIRLSRREGADERASAAHAGRQAGRGAVV